MFKDDKMLSVLSGIVLMLAIGTLVQRGDVVADFFSGDAEEIVLLPDAVTVEADTLTRIDVLSNDTGLQDRDATRLVVLSQPGCGRVFVQDGALQYLGERDCGAEQRIVYGLSETSEDLSGEVVITVNGATGAAEPVARREAEDAVASAADPQRKPEPTQPAPGPQGMDQLAAGSAEEPARPGMAALETPAAGGVPAVRAPSVPSMPRAGGLIAAPRVGSDAPISAPSGGSSAPSASGRAPELALRAPEMAQPSMPAAPSAGGDRSPPAARSGDGPAPRTAAAEPASPRSPAALGAPLAAPSVPSEPSLAGIGAADTLPAGAGSAGDAPARSAPGGLGAGVATIALARVEVPDSVAAPSAARSQELSLNVERAETATAPSAPRVASEIDGTDGQQITMLEPSAGLGEILAFGDPLTLRPLDTSLPAELSAPTPDAGGDSGARQAALQPSTGVVAPGGAGATAQPEALPQPERVAALPRVDLTCAVPPSITLDIRPAGETELVITSPCHADSVAQLAYEGFDLGIRIDRSGQGSVTVLGFQSSSEAVLAFADGETLPFSLPFSGTDRVERVALAWDAPVGLELHALEFGSPLGGEGHVSPQSPGEFSDVRRRGGGYLTSYEPVEGVGQSVQIYSHWLRRGGKAGVVKLYIDFVSRHRERQDGTCGNGPLSRPSFTVVRASRGRLEAPISRRLASVDCATVETMQDHLIEAAVRDIIISQR